ncbi:MAG: ATP-dependent DNA helicase RecQ [Acholeplasmatales bacterium]|nr:ATP-dependent DNA helicase RecQ [Acholeplasmatales bacterium]
MRKEEILKSYYGYDYLKKEQNQIVDSILDGHDTIGILPTGYGKSITFQIPSLILDGITIVITPLIALMADQVDGLKRRKIKAAYINSLQTKEEQDNIYNKLIKYKIKLLYVSAERLLSAKFLENIKKVKISLIVCDEAHTLLWSEDFREALGRIPEFIDGLPFRPRLLALTATATKQTIEKIINYIGIRNPNIIACNCDRKNIFYSIVKVKDKKKELREYINKRRSILGIIYCFTIKNAKDVYDYLISLGYSVGLYHGALSKEDKNKVQQQFTKKEIKIMVCTNAFGMGIDIPCIRYVIEYDMPSSIEDFLQQSGRASRDGKYAESVVYFNMDDIKMNEYFIDNINNDNKSDAKIRKIKQDRYKKLDSMISLCLTKKCLHKMVCKYFNFKHNGKCNMCSNCKKLKNDENTQKSNENVKKFRFGIVYDEKK